MTDNNNENKGVRKWSSFFFDDEGKQRPIGLALHQIWFTTYSKRKPDGEYYSSEERNEIIEMLLSVYTDSEVGLNADAKTVSMTQAFLNQRINHPESHVYQDIAEINSGKVARKQRVKVSVQDVIVDYLTYAGLSDGEVLSLSQTMRNQRMYAKYVPEVLTDFEADKEDAADIEGLLYKKSPEIYKDSYDMLQDMASSTELEIAEFKQLIEEMQKSPTHNARRLCRKYVGNYKNEDGTRDMDGYNKFVANTARVISRLNVEKVKVCEECGQVYHQYSANQTTCSFFEGVQSCRNTQKKRKDRERLEKNN